MTVFSLAFFIALALAFMAFIMGMFKEDGPMLCLSGALILLMMYLVTVGVVKI